MQLVHHNTQFSRQIHDIILLCDQVNSPANIGSIFRIADSFGVSKIIFGNVFVDVNSARLKRTARATQNRIDYQDEADLKLELSQLKNQGYQSFALEITDQSQSITKFQFPKTKIALIIGEERHGVQQDLLNLCDAHIHINMFGNNSSMNVAQATAIALYEITKQITNYG